MRASRRLLGLVFVVAGLLHFIRPRMYEQIMPEWIPLHREAVLASGVAEAVGGAALLSDRSARFGCWWLVVTLLAVFPANVHMATNPDDIPVVVRLDLSPWLLWARLPLQPLLVALLVLVTYRSTSPPTD